MFVCPCLFHFFYRYGFNIMFRLEIMCNVLPSHINDLQILLFACAEILVAYYKIYSFNLCKGHLPQRTLVNEKIKLLKHELRNRPQTQLHLASSGSLMRKLTKIQFPSRHDLRPPHFHISHELPHPLRKTIPARSIVFAALPQPFAVSAHEILIFILAWNKVYDGSSLYRSLSVPFLRAPWSRARPLLHNFTSA